MMMMTMTLAFMMRQLKPQMIVTSMNIDHNIQIISLIIFLDHKSQGLHNHKHFSFCNSYT
jgi:hypothetical protein